MATLSILLTGKIVGGSEIEWNIAPLEDEPTDGELARLIWEAEELEDLREDMEDRAFWAHGSW